MMRLRVDCVHTLLLLLLLSMRILDRARGGGGRDLIQDDDLSQRLTVFIKQLVFVSCCCSIDVLQLYFAVSGLGSCLSESRCQTS